MTKRKVMGKRAARKWLFNYAADLLRNFADSDPIANRDFEHPDDPEAAEKETAVLQDELKWVAGQLEKKGSGGRR